MSGVLTPPVPKKDEKTPATQAQRQSHSSAWGRGFLIKLLLVALVDALGVYGIVISWTLQSWGIVAFLVIALIAVNVVYFSRKMVPAKYLVPGLIFLLVYQVFVIFYTGATAFTNYGDGHNSTKEDAISSLLANNSERLPDSPSYAVTIVQRGEDFFFLTTDPTSGDALLGGENEPLHTVKNANVEDGKATSITGFDTLKFADVLANQKAIFDLEVPLSDDPNAGYLRTTDGSTGFVYQSNLKYDAQSDTITNAQTGVVYTAGPTGNFVSPDGTKLEPGWKVTVGFDNFTSVLTNSTLRGPFFGVLAWTFAFAFLSMTLTFGIGLFLALVLNDPRVRGRKIYRSLLILPYAFPAFLAAMVWQGMLNEKFGFVNQILLGGADIPWLSSPWLARLAVLMVNIWMGFPYMFLICTGAIQSLPGDVEEAAKMDGAKAWRIFKSIKLPLLLVSTAPLLISSFAYNFNNFNAIYLLTEGGPLEHPTDAAGATDILISFVYRLAFGGVNRQYGLACAISILIFIIVATISAISFKRTKSLEELN